MGQILHAAMLAAHPGREAQAALADRIDGERAATIADCERRADAYAQGDRNARDAYLIGALQGALQREIVRRVVAEAARPAPIVCALASDDSVQWVELTHPLLGELEVGVTFSRSPHDDMPDVDCVAVRNGDGDSVSHLLTDAAVHELKELAAEVLQQQAEDQADDGEPA